MTLKMLDNSNPFKTRIAPTPSGFLHIGNGASFVATWVLARVNAGKILLRIDDLDAERMRPEYVEDIFKTLDWLGLDWDEGPFSVADFSQNWSQHLRLDLYEKALSDLQKTGDLYICNCSRKDIKLRSKNGLYPNTCRENRLSNDGKTSARFETSPTLTQNTAWRIVVEENKSVHFKNLEKKGLLSINGIFDAENAIFNGFDDKTSVKFQTSPTLMPINLCQMMGDFIIRQKNGLPSYQLASLVDDTLYNINFIVRGEDLLNSTAAQIFLAEKLNNADFLSTNFWHHPLITDADGAKLSKSEGAASLLDFRRRNDSAAIVVKQAATWLGFADFNGKTALELVDFIKK
jgi:glutamyl/glutaminyl-tRNA synthetase